MTDMRTPGLTIPQAAARFIVLILIATAPALLPDAGVASSARAIGDTVGGSDVPGTVSVTASPRVLSFGRQAVGTKSSSQALSLAAGAPFQMNARSPSLGGSNPGDFVLQGGACSIADPVPTNFCSFFVAFAPKVEGLRVATLSFSDNASDSPQTIVLTGLGVRPGYWLVASDGGVFTFGDAAFFGSTGGMALREPIVSSARNPAP